MSVYDYRCTVTFADGTELVSEMAELTVNTYINITSHPNDQVVVLGYKGQFTVAATGEGLSYRWQYSRNGNTWAYTTAEGCTTATLTVAAKGKNGYRYRCVLTGLDGTAVLTEVAGLTVQ